MDVRARFERFVLRMDSGCWEWQGARKQGVRPYGFFSINGRQFTAHRVCWNLYRGAIPAGLHVCHHCDNPPCVNPEHLFLGTAKDNAQDKVKKGRHHKTLKLNPQEMALVLDKSLTTAFVARTLKHSKEAIRLLRVKHWSVGRG